MYHKILVAYNGTPESLPALQECIRLAPGPSAEIHLLVAIIPAPFLLAGEFVAAAIPSAEEEREERQVMERILASGHALLAEAGLNVATHLEVGEPVALIADLVHALGIELVILGHSRHMPFALRWWRGSTDALLVEKIRCSVLVAADPPHAS